MNNKHDINIASHSTNKESLIKMKSSDKQQQYLVSISNVVNWLSICPPPAKKSKKKYQSQQILYAGMVGTCMYQCSCNQIAQ